MIGCLLLVTYLIKRYDQLFIIGNLFNKVLLNKLPEMNNQS
jgi:hypothetical protein